MTLSCNTHRDQHGDAGHVARPRNLEPGEEDVRRERAQGRRETERGDVLPAVRMGERGGEERCCEREGRRGCAVPHATTNPGSIWR